MKTSDYERPKVGIGVMIFKDGKVLLAKRKGSHGSGEYAFPGGHLEFGESFEQCAKRETREEAGIEIKNVKFQFLSNLKKYRDKHYVHIGLLAEWSSGVLEVLEPGKSEEWGWYDPTRIPKPIFETCHLAIESLMNKNNYYDS